MRGGRTMRDEIDFLKELRNIIEPDLDEYHNGIIEIDTRIKDIEDANVLLDEKESNDERT